MPTATRRSARWYAVGPALALVVALAAGVVIARRGDDHEPGADVSTLPAEVTSDAPRFTTLEELVMAADVVVRGEVAHVERGRVFGEPGGANIVSRLVTLDVADVLAGTAPPTAAVLVEEEGWLDDGRPLIVDGAAPSAEGDDGIWFLVEVGDPDVPSYVVVNAQGRYLVSGGSLKGAGGDDRLVTELAALSVDALAARVTAIAG